jgi:hypothetical protein
MLIQPPQRHQPKQQALRFARKPACPALYQNIVDQSKELYRVCSPWFRFAELP